MALHKSVYYYYYYYYYYILSTVENQSPKIDTLPTYTFSTNYQSTTITHATYVQTLPVKTGKTKKLGKVKCIIVTNMPSVL